MRMLAGIRHGCGVIAASLFLGGRARLLSRRLLIRRQNGEKRATDRRPISPLTNDEVLRSRFVSDSLADLPARRVSAMRHRGYARREAT